MLAWVLHAREIDPGPPEKGGTMFILDSPDARFVMSFVIPNTHRFRYL